MTFSDAITSIKAGKQVQRSGWNGKGMYIWLNKGSYDNTVENQALSDIEGVDKSLFTIGDTGTAIRLPNINMHSATGATVTGWLASQTDLLSQDWGEISV